MEINNLNKIKSFLEFRSSDDFYFLQIIQRKKDHTDRKVNGANNNSRLIKAYYIDSLDYLDFIIPEVIELCKVFKARAGINLNRRSFERVAFLTLKKLTDQIIHKDYNKIKKAYNTVCGKHHSETDKRWILDYDFLENEDQLSHHKYKILKSTLFGFSPLGDKVIDVLPSLNGVHIITSPFNIAEATPFLKDQNITVHKNNPTNLYIPEL